MKRRGAARALCLDDLGAIAGGAPADLLVLEGNPLEDLRHTRAIDAVVFRGEVMTRAQPEHAGARCAAAADPDTLTFAPEQLLRKPGSASELR